MCRWLAYYGKPVRMDKVLFGPQHSLIEQSLSSRMGAEPTNGDGFGIGWYSASGEPGIFKSMEPAWNDRNLRELAGHVESHLFLAHVRATTGTPVQQTNCHPFRYGKWLWVHNGLIGDWLTVKRDLALAVDPALYPLIEGTTDSEVLFFLAVTLGLEDDPPGAVERAIGLVEDVGRAARGRVPVPGHHRDDRRRAALGVPLRERRQGPLALLLDVLRDAEDAVSRRPERSTTSTRRRGSSSPSPSETSSASGTPSPRRAGASCSRGRTSSARSGRHRRSLPDAATRRRRRTQRHSPSCGR